MARSRRRRVSCHGRRISQQSTRSISITMSQTDYVNGQITNNENPKAEESEESEDDELPILPRQFIPDSELSPQYWFLLKVVKYIKFGSPTATLLALCGLNRYDLTLPMCQQALENSEAVDVLINVLEADDHKCKVAALRVLQNMVKIQHFQRLLVMKSGIATVVKLLSEAEPDVRCLAAGTLAHAVNNHRSRMLTRKAGAVPLLVDLLDIQNAPVVVTTDEFNLKAATKQKIQAATAAAKALRSLSYSSSARRDMYLAGGIPLLTRLTLSVGGVHREYPQATSSSLTHHRAPSVASTTTGQRPSVNVKSRLTSRRAMAASVYSDSELDFELLTAVNGVIHQCAADDIFRASVRADMLLGQLLRHMRYDCETLQTLCASTIAHFAEDETNRRVLTQLKATETIVWVLKQGEYQLQMASNYTIPRSRPEDEQPLELQVQIDRPTSHVEEKQVEKPQVNISLLKAVSTAVWKLSLSPEARDRFRQLGIVRIFIRHLNQSTEEVLLPIVSSISVIGTDPESLALLRTERAVPRFVWLLSGNHPGLLSAAALTMANLTADLDALELLETIDAARLLWSLLKHPSPVVQAGAASAIAAFSERSKRAGEVARSLVGGLELLVSLLRAPELEVVTAAAAAVARMATEDETLAVLSDHHVVTLLASLVRHKNRDLKLRVAEAIAECCRWPGNPAQLGQGGGVKPLIGYLRSSHLDLRRAAAKALHQVSSDRENCFILHHHGAVMLLLKLVGCGDVEIQSAAAGCLSNIRNFIHNA
ncbi:outer dynein arm-docking complex subunit 2 [Daphnia magna]|uniref:Armadillo repeat-containing protein n=1 Tax=Daphnia magna TaxID=35525 RepID=A0ABR0A2L8_9CRUS|nr:outer dynein arm-docking complex subunit 2 [Daphnia magna]KAK4019361.1 hypothetical protein OUZ56_001385 [Daphnia magna]